MGLPKRWLPYSNFGQPIPGTRFIALKCPLKPALCQQIPQEKQFTPSLVMERLPALKMIIDLTFTSKYYTPEVFQGAGLRHVKVLCEGHNVPNKKVIEKFFSIVDGFLNEENEGLIGVHCTHGVNRTGFLICKYMISKLGFEPEEAIKVFGEARGHCIERANYLCSLGLNNRQAEKLAGRQPESYPSPENKVTQGRDRGWTQPPHYQQRDEQRWEQRQDYWSGPPQHPWRGNQEQRFGDSRPHYEYNPERQSRFLPRGRGNWNNFRGNYQDRGNSRWGQGGRPQGNLSWRRSPEPNERFDRRGGDARAGPETNERFDQRGGNTREKTEANERLDQRGGNTRRGYQSNERFNRKGEYTQNRPESNEQFGRRGGDTRSRPEFNERLDRKDGNTRPRPEFNERLDKRDGDTQARPESNAGINVESKLNYGGEWSTQTKRKRREDTRRPREEYPGQNILDQREKRYCDPLQPRELYPKTKEQRPRDSCTHKGGTPPHSQQS